MVMVSPRPPGLRNDLNIGTAQSQVMKEFPFFAGRDFAVQTGEGPGFAEFYPPTESRNPNPGRATVEIRPQSFDLPTPEMESVILGDLLHAAPDFDEGFAEQKQNFISSLRPSQMAVIEDMYTEQQQRGDQRTLDEFIDQSAADAFIRDFFFQSREAIPGGRPFVSGVGPEMGAFFPDQMPILRKMEAIVKGTPKR